MGLNLKNPRAHELAAELSHLTGQSLTQAIISALERQLEVERDERQPKTTTRRILAFAERFAPGIKTEQPPPTTRIYITTAECRLDSRHV